MDLFAIPLTIAATGYSTLFLFLFLMFVWPGDRGLGGVLPWLPRLVLPRFRSRWIPRRELDALESALAQLKRDWVPRAEWQALQRENETIRSQFTRDVPATNSSYVVKGTAVQTSRAVFRPRGMVWECAFRNGPTFYVPPRKGFQYIHHLLKNPDKEIRALDLVSRFGRQSISVQESGQPENSFAVHVGEEAYPVLDEQAIREMRTRLTSLPGEIAAARAATNLKRVQKLEDEKRWIESELNALIGRGGRRRTFPDSQERARKSVHNAIADALLILRANDQAMYQHLREHISASTYVIYRAEPAFRWDTDARA